MRIPHRLLRSGVALVAVLTTYAAYALVAVPWIEPEATRLDLQEGSSSAQEQRTLPNSKSDRLRRWFGDESWVLGHPKILESRQAMLLIDDYQPQPDGTVRLSPFAMVLFVSPEAKDDPARDGEAVILQAPAAVLTFDRPLDLRRGDVGRLQSGRLEGEITIHSDRNDAKGADDLRIVTRDVQLNEDRVWTDAPVTFRLGSNHGSGRRMVIDLVPTAGAETSDRRGPGVSGIRSLRLTHDVKMEMQMAGRGLLPEKDNRAKPPDGRGRRAEKKPGPPVRVTSRGPFHFDFEKYVATFVDQVDVSRIHPVGPSDQLNCEQLSVYFVPGKPKGNPDAERNEVANDPAAVKKIDDGAGSDELRMMGSLTAQRIEAVGNPVVVRSPSTGAAARCRRLEYDIATGRVTLEHENGVMLKHRRRQVYAPRVAYEPAAGDRLGRIEADGPGWMEAEMGETPGVDVAGQTRQDRPASKFRAEWGRELRVRPHEGRQLLSMVGGAKLEHFGQGVLSADEIWFWMIEREQPRDANRANAARGAGPSIQSSVLPDRMVAIGNVTVDSQQLSGQPGRLEVWFEHVAPSSLADSRSDSAASDRPAAGSAGDRASGNRSGVASDRSTSGVDRSSATAGSHYRIHSELVRIKVLSDGQTTAVDGVTAAGNVDFTESADTGGELPQKPLSIRGSRVQVHGAQSPETRVVVTGKPATVEARGMEMRGAQIELDRRANRLWIDGPGDMTLPVDRDLKGRPLPRPESINVSWKERMNFDGLRVRYENNVEARGSSQRLLTDVLEVHLRDRIDFAEPPGGSDQVKLGQLACSGGAYLESRTYADGRLESTEWMKVRDLSIHESSGVIVAHGPGWVKSIRRGGTDSPLAASPNQPRAGASDPGDTSKEKPLSYVFVRFEKAIRGNLKTRETTFSDQVRTVYSPVRDWNAEVADDDPRKLDPRGVLLTSDRLTLRQMQAVSRKEPDWIEIEAAGNAIAEAPTFTARAHSMKYTQAKDLLILDGENVTDAVLSRQTQVGGRISSVAAGKILYWRSEPRVEVDRFRYGDLSQIGRSPGE